MFDRSPLGQNALLRIDFKNVSSIIFRRVGENFKCLAICRVVVRL